MALRAGFISCMLGGLALACGSRSGLLGDGELEPGVGNSLPEQAASSAPLVPVDEPPAPPPELRGCVDRTLNYDTLPPTVLFLIDQSGSMDQRFGGSSRWDVLRSAIVDPNDGVLSQLDASVSVGIMLYTSLDGYSGGTCPMLSEVLLALGNAQEIRRLYLGSEPFDRGDTPTPEAIDAAADRLVELAEPGPRYVVLLTDGEPDTCSQPDPQRGGSEALAAAQRAHAKGVRLVPVGISNEISRRSIQELANAAAGKAPELQWGQDADAERPLFASESRQELAAQLKGVIGDARSCIVELGENVGAVRAGEGRLQLDGQALRFDTPNGWTFEDDDTIEVHGASCESILAQGHRLEVYFPCVSADPLPPR